MLSLGRNSVFRYLSVLALSATFSCAADDASSTRDEDNSDTVPDDDGAEDDAPPAPDPPGADAGMATEAGSAPARADASAQARDAQSAMLDGGVRANAEAAVSDASQPAASDARVSDARAPSPSSDAAVATCTPSAEPPKALALRGDLGAHDPAVIESEGQYYLFVTGRGIPTKRSTDLTNWQRGSAVFAQNPAWIAQRVPGATDLWAPDISYFGGAYHLYYSASTFGSNRSCIGHATRTSLTSGAWQDRGPVICSNADGQRHDWNAIDPNVALDESGTPFLSFGSFWSGIKLVKLTSEGARADDAVLAIAGRANGGAIEAPFIVRRCDQYYLFVSFDTCCKGADSTYRIMVGRSRTIQGPYMDKAGMPLTRGGGTQVLQGDMRWRGPGHNAVLMSDRGAFNVYHAYAASDGHSELRISELGWDAQGWPTSAGP